MNKMTKQSDGVAAPRADVGYKRPPIEHQFRKGQKPPPRKKKPVAELDATMLFWKVLQEPRRAKINGKASWVTSAELIVRCAYTQAEKGSSTLQRLLNELLLNGDAEGSGDDYDISLE